MDIFYICNHCQKNYEIRSLKWRCFCGGLFNIKPYEFSFPLNEIKKRPATMWRYKEALPFSSKTTVWKSVTMGEGFTPIVPFDSNKSNLLLKMDFMMPTLSFKDRGAVILISKAKELGVKRLIADSSGNAGTSIAAYASKAGIQCEIYVPEGTSPKKLKQMKAHGATVHIVSGNREDTAKAAIEAVEKNKIFYASHVYNPLFYEGTKTYAFEIWEQFDGDIPDILVIPVGNGTLLLGVYEGFKQLRQAGMISHMPQIIAVQAAECSPLAQAFQHGKKEAVFVQNTGTVAEGIAIADPARHRQILKAIDDCNGIIVTASEENIKRARKELAKKGFYVEPTTAATYAGFSTYLADNKENNATSQSKKKVLIPLCGAGLKAT